MTCAYFNGIGAKTVPPRMSDAWHTLKPIPRGKGYLTVNLGGGPRKIARLIHQLVLEAFVGPRPPGLVCCHADGDRTDNRLQNLRWDSYLANSEDMLRHGTRLMGSRANAKLTEEQVAEIRRLRADGESFSDLAGRFGVTYVNILAVVYRRTWRHVP